jgi:histone-lysine N-methyltransferase SETD2
MVPGLPSGGWNAKQKKTGDRGDGKTASGVNDNVWHRIHRNIFTHREPKSVTEDDVLICSCVPDPVTGEGCGDECINRDVLVECDPNFCPCGSKCQNQKFQSKRYAKLDIRRTGKKGHGLFTKQALRKGEFIVEYVGEVLHEDEYRARKNRYEAEGKRHYYFMTLSSSETIDAAERGNAGRFLNHSCQPNCETQKWMVNGELCIGIYALEPVAADEELTFDYNFERYGDNPIKCYCGTKKCGGWIGGGQKDGEDGDDMTKAAADEDPEDYYEPAPVMLEADESEIAEEETRGREARARARLSNRRGGADPFKPKDVYGNDDDDYDGDGEIAARKKEAQQEANRAAREANRAAGRSGSGGSGMRRSGSSSLGVSRKGSAGSLRRAHGAPEGVLGSVAQRQSRGEVRAAVQPGVPGDGGGDAERVAARPGFASGGGGAHHQPADADHSRGEGAAAGAADVRAETGRRRGERRPRAHFTESGEDHRRHRRQLAVRGDAEAPGHQNRARQPGAGHRGLESRQRPGAARARGRARRQTPGGRRE